MATAVFDNINAGTLSPAAVATPVLGLSVSPETGSSPLLVTAYITALVPSGHAFGSLTVDWDDGSAATITTATTLQHTYTAGGSHNVVVTAVYDGATTFTGLDAVTVTASTTTGSVAGLSVFDNVNVTPILPPSATVPGALTNVVATALSATSVRLTWTAPLTGGAVGFVQITGDPALPGPITTVSSPTTLNGLTAETLYTLTLLPYNGAGAGTSVNVAVTTLPGPITPPVDPPPVDPSDLVQPSQYAFPQPERIEDVRVFKPANFGKTIDEVPKGD